MNFKELNKIELLPISLNDAISILITYFNKETLKNITNMSEEEFISSSHFGIAMFIRNAWNLWWQESEYQKPKLVAYFNSKGIYHADDMSCIIFTSLYRHLTGKKRELDKQLKTYKTHWKKQGYKNGVYNPSLL